MRTPRLAGLLLQACKAASCLSHSIGSTLSNWGRLKPSGCLPLSIASVSDGERRVSVAETGHAIRCGRGSVSGTIDRAGEGWLLQSARSYALQTGAVR